MISWIVRRAALMAVPIVISKLMHRYPEQVDSLKSQARGAQKWGTREGDRLAKNLPSKSVLTSAALARMGMQKRRRSPGRIVLASLGGALMTYFMDPEKGHQRRSQLRERVMGMVGKAGSMGSGLAEKGYQASRAVIDQATPSSQNGPSGSSASRPPAAPGPGTSSSSGTTGSASAGSTGTSGSTGSSGSSAGSSGSSTASPARGPVGSTPSGNGHAGNKETPPSRS